MIVSKSVNGWLKAVDFIAIMTSFVWIDAFKWTTWTPFPRMALLILPTFQIPTRIKFSVTTLNYSCIFSSVVILKIKPSDYIYFFDVLIRSELLSTWFYWFLCTLMTLKEQEGDACISRTNASVSSVKNRWLSVVYLVLLLRALPLFFEPPTNTDLMGLKMISECVAE